MGMHPAEVKACTAWEFWAAWTGFVEFNTPPSDDVEPMTRAELDELLRDHNPNGR